MMRKKTGAIIIAVFAIQLFTGCVCAFKKTNECNDEQYGPVAIRLAEFSSQVIYYYRNKKQAVPLDFDAIKYIQILRQLPPDQVNQNYVNSIVSKFTISAHAIGDGFSIMLCDKNKKIMEDFANSHNEECRFDLNRVEIRSWNESVGCSFETDWQRFCKIP
jgi:hypothetical protein